MIMKFIRLISIFILTYSLSAKALNKSIAGSVFNSWIQGKIVNTDNPSDLAISGIGFIPVQKSTHQIYYTRSLSIRMDKDGDLVQNGSGYKILHASEGVLKTIHVADKAQKPYQGQPGRYATLTGFALTNEGEIEGAYSDGSVDKITYLNIAIFQNQRQLKLKDSKYQLLASNKFTGEVSYVLPRESGAGQIFGKSQENLDKSYYQMNLDN